MHNLSVVYIEKMAKAIGSTLLQKYVKAASASIEYRGDMASYFNVTLLLLLLCVYSFTVYYV